jgi:hypothetical protein
MVHSKPAGPDRGAHNLRGPTTKSPGGTVTAKATAKTAAERKRDERERMRNQGFVLRQLWVHPKDWPRVQRYLERVLRLRRK